MSPAMSPTYSIAFVRTIANREGAWHGKKTHLQIAGEAGNRDGLAVKIALLPPSRDPWGLRDPMGLMLR